MRVALITNTFPSDTHPYIAEWANELVSRGIDLDIITEATPASVPYQSFLAETDLTSRILRLNNISQRFWSLRFLTTTLPLLVRYRQAFATVAGEHSGNLRRIVRKAYEYTPLFGRQYDVVHFNAPQIAIRRFELGKMLGAKTVVSFRGQDFTFHPDRYDRLLREADHLHFISQHLLDEARGRGYEGEKHSLIPPMVDTELYAPPAQLRSRGTMPFQLFTAARLSWTKGFEFALQAVALLVEQGIDLHYSIAGNGEDEASVRYTIDELGLNERVHLLGLLSPEQVRDRMWASDLYLLASVTEGFNNSVLQAQACGLPVVCSDAGGLTENVVDGVTGLIARRRDAWDLADKVGALLHNPGLRLTMSENAARRAQEAFALPTVTSGFLELYSKL